MKSMVGNSWAYNPNSWSRAIFLRDSYFLFPQVCLLSFSLQLCSWCSNVISGTPFKLMDERWFHMSLASPPTSSLGKHGDVMIAVPIILCMFTSSLWSQCTFYRAFLEYGHRAGKNPSLPRPSLGFLWKPFLLLNPSVLEHTLPAFFIAAVWLKWGLFPEE